MKLKGCRQSSNIFDTEKVPQKIQKNRCAHRLCPNSRWYSLLNTNADICHDMNPKKQIRLYCRCCAAQYRLGSPSSPMRHISRYTQEFSCDTFDLMQQEAGVTPLSSSLQQSSSYASSKQVTRISPGSSGTLRLGGCCVIRQQRYPRATRARQLGSMQKKNSVLTQDLVSAIGSSLSIAQISITVEMEVFTRQLYKGSSIDLVHLGASVATWALGSSCTGSSSSWESSGESSSARLSSSSLVDPRHHWVESVLDLLLVSLVLSGLSLGVGVQPCLDLCDLSCQVGLLSSLELVIQLLIVQGVLDVDQVALKTVLGLDLLPDELILILVLLGILDQFLDVLLREPSLVVGDGDLSVLGGSLVHGSDVHDSVLVDLERHVDLGNSSGGRGNTVEVELAQKVVVLRQLSLSLEDLDQDSGLVISVGGEGLRLLGGDGCVPGNQNCHHTSSGLNAQRQGGDVDQKQGVGLLRSLTCEDSSLDGSAVGNSLIGVDGSVWLLSSKEFGEEFNDLGDSGGSSNKDDVVDEVLGHSRVLEDLLDWGDGVLEHGKTELLELGPGEGDGVVEGLGQRVDLNGGLSRGGQDSLGLLALGSQPSDGSGVFSDVHTVLLEEVSGAVLDKLGVEVLSSQMGVTGGGLDLKDSLVDGQQRNIKGSSSEIEDENVPLSLSLLVQTIGDSSSCWFVDDSEHVHSGDGSGILGGLSLVVVEVGGDGNHGILDGGSQERLGSLPHLDQDHGGDLLGVELLVLSLELDNDHGLVLGSGLDGEGPELHVLLDDGVAELPADEPLGVVDTVGRVLGDLVLGSIPDESFGFCECDI